MGAKTGRTSNRARGIVLIIGLVGSNKSGTASSLASCPSMTSVLTPSPKQGHFCHAEICPWTRREKIIFEDNFERAGAEIFHSDDRGFLRAIVQTEGHPSLILDTPGGLS